MLTIGRGQTGWRNNLKKLDTSRNEESGMSNDMDLDKALNNAKSIIVLIITLVVAIAAIGHTYYSVGDLKERIAKLEALDMSAEMKVNSLKLTQLGQKLDSVAAVQQKILDSLMNRER